jgi:hypothetical protein
VVICQAARCERLLTVDGMEVAVAVRLTVQPALAVVGIVLVSAVCVGRGPSEPIALSL